MFQTSQEIIFQKVNKVLCVPKTIPLYISRQRETRNNSHVILFLPSSSLCLHPKAKSASRDSLGISRYIFIEQPYLLFLSRMSASLHNIIISKRSEKLKCFKNYLHIIFYPIVTHYITVNNSPRYSISSITLLSSLKRLYFTLSLSKTSV